jgi:predicted adenylyl cyclase CyaB
MPVNIEIKAKVNELDHFRDWLLEHGADFIGTDYQTDTYFEVQQGRLKLRQGNIENNLIWYQRPDHSGPKRSDFILLPAEDPETLKSLLTASLGIRCVVEKSREIYFIDNVKFHLDQVAGLGQFLEIEAGNITSELSPAQLQQQCDYYCKALGVATEDLLEGSYADLLLV